MPSLSKSEAKGLGCEFYYRKYYTEKTPQHEMAWTRTGKQFHEFMATYASYLVANGQHQDLDWVEKALTNGDIEDEARVLIENYTRGWFLVDPEAVLGIEVFYVIDVKLQPVRHVEFPGVGKRPDVRDALAHGTLDLIERIGGDSLRITDYKTGFLPGNVDGYEAKHYAILAFCWFDWCQEVTFRWEFPRFGTKIQEVTYNREALPSLLGDLYRKIARRTGIEATPDDRLGCDPLAGLCGYCALACPARVVAMNGDSIFRPIQDDGDLKIAAGTLAAIRSARNTLEAQVRNYLYKVGAVELGEGKAAYLTTSFSPQYQLRTVLAALGLEVPEKSPQYDVPLDALMVNSSELKRFCATKKRAGLLDTLSASVTTKPRTELCIGSAQSMVEG